MSEQLNESNEQKKPKTTKEVIDAEPKVSVFIPRPDGDEREFMPVMINELTYLVALDKWVDVPQSVAAVIRDMQAASTRVRRQLEEMRKSMNQTATAGVYGG